MTHTSIRQQGTRSGSQASGGFSVSLLTVMIRQALERRI
jgi:hypothetical protein